MAEISATYQPKVGSEQGGDKLYIKEDGEFKFYDTDVTGLQLRNMLALSLNGEKDILLSGVNLVVATSCINMVSNYIMYKVSFASNAANLSWFITSCVAGQEVYVRTVNGSAAAGSGGLHIETSGCSIAYLSGTGINSIFLSDAIGSSPFVHLRCFTDGQWTVLETRGLVQA